MKIRILWVNDKHSLENQSVQTKTFDNTDKAIEWCRRNSKHILQINNSKYFFEDGSYTVRTNIATDGMVGENYMCTPDYFEEVRTS